MPTSEIAALFDLHPAVRATVGFAVLAIAIIVLSKVQRILQEDREQTKLLQEYKELAERATAERDKVEDELQKKLQETETERDNYRHQMDILVAESNAILLERTALELHLNGKIDELESKMEALVKVCNHIIGLLPKENRETAAQLLQFVPEGKKNVS